MGLFSGIGGFLVGQVVLHAKSSHGLEQLILLLPLSLGRLSVRTCPLGQVVELLLSLVGVVVGLHLLGPKAGQLLIGRSKLGHLPMGGSELLS